jgi:CheY-like chemotaxis protein
LVDGLLQFSRKQPQIQFQTVNLTNVIHEVYQLIVESFDKRIQILVDSLDLLPVTGDHCGLSQALMNLCTNARDAMPMGGVLRLKAGIDGDQAVVAVSDTGRGMDETVKTRCFDPFFTTKEVGKGTGLGLSTTYGIIRAHGGSIAVCSEPQNGSVFTLRLPLAQVAVESRLEGREALETGKGQTILVVDDEIAILEAMPELLERMGYHAVLARGPKEALAMYRAIRPSVVLMDRNMPEMDGLRCAEQIAAHDPQANIVIVSGYEKDNPDDGDGLRQPFIKGYLTKPPNLKELSVLLANLVQAKSSECAVPAD